MSVSSFLVVRDFWFVPGCRGQSAASAASSESLISWAVTRVLATSSPPCRALPAELRRRIYGDYLREAERLADELEAQPVQLQELEGELGTLQFFDLPQGRAGA